LLTLQTVSHFQPQKVDLLSQKQPLRPHVLPTAIALNLCGLQGSLGVSYPKSVFQPGVEHYLAVGAWGDAPFEAVIACDTLMSLVENALPGCLLREASSSVRALLVEQLVSEISSSASDESPADIRIASVILGATPFGQHMVNLHFESQGLSLQVGLYGNDMLLETWNKRQIGNLHTSAAMPNVSVPVVFVAGTTDLTVADLKRLKVGQGLLFDTTLLPQKKIVARLGDDHLAICSQWSDSLSVDGRFHRASAVMMDGWREFHTLNNAPGNNTMTQDNPGSGGLDTLKIRLNFELGRTELPLAQLTTLAPGHVFALPSNTSGTVDIVAGGSVIGKGDIVQIGTGVGVRIVRLD
jgi:type III secretion protein Q